MSSSLLFKSVKIAAISTLFGCALNLAIKDAFAFGENDSEEGTCSFSKQLEDKSERDNFLKQLNAAKEASFSRYGEIMANTVKFRRPDGQIVEIDTFSVGCLSCHDGITAPARDIRIKNDTDPGVSIQSVLGSHPIGMNYGSYAYARREYKSLQALDPNMTLIDGKVGCLTCHNPLNPEKNHLAMNNDNSRLCFACHSK